MSAFTGFRKQIGSRFDFMLTLNKRWKQFDVSRLPVFSDISGSYWNVRLLRESFQRGSHGWCEVINLPSSTLHFFLYLCLSLLLSLVLCSLLSIRALCSWRSFSWALLHPLCAKNSTRVYLLCSTFLPSFTVSCFPGVLLGQQRCAALCWSSGLIEAELFPLRTTSSVSLAVFKETVFSALLYEEGSVMCFWGICCGSVYVLYASLLFLQLYVQIRARLQFDALL